MCTQARTLHVCTRARAHVHNTRRRAQRPRPQSYRHALHSPAQRTLTARYQGRSHHSPIQEDRVQEGRGQSRIQGGRRPEGRRRGSEGQPAVGGDAASAPCHTPHVDVSPRKPSLTCLD